MSPDAPTELGSASPDGQELRIGALDEVAFYRDALSAKTVLGHYEALMGGPAEPPAVVFTLAGNELTLSWPAGATGFSLESTDTLPATTWIAVPGVVSDRITVNVANGMRFFRPRGR